MTHYEKTEHQKEVSDIIIFKKLQVTLRKGKLLKMTKLLKYLQNIAKFLILFE